MPKTRVKTPDGQEYIVTHPEGASQKEIRKRLDAELAAATSVSSPEPRGYRNYGRALIGAAEGGFDLLGKALNMGIGGFAGLTSLGDGLDVAVNRIKTPGALRRSITEFTSPRTMEGKTFSEGLEKAGEPIAELTGLAAGGATDLASFAGLPPEAAGLVGAGVETAIGGGPAVFGRGLAGKRLPASNLKQATYQQGQAVGYRVPPSDARAGTVRQGPSAMLDGPLGKPRLQQDASLKNQQVTNRLAAESLGLDPGTEISRAVLQRVRNEAGEAYSVLKGAGQISVDLTYRKALSDIRRDAKKGTQDFDKLNDSDLTGFIEYLDDANKWSFSSESAIRLMRKLRNQSDKYYNKGSDMYDPKLGGAYRELSNAVENMAERHLATIAPDAVDAFRAARQRIAKSYTIEEALDGDGYVAASKLAKAKADGVPLDDNLRLVADMHEQFPASMKVQKAAPIAAGRISTLTGAAGAGSAVGGQAQVGIPLMLAAFGPSIVRGARLTGAKVGPRTVPFADPLGLGITGLIGDPAVSPEDR